MSVPSGVRMTASEVILRNALHRDPIDAVDMPKVAEKIRGMPGDIMYVDAPRFPFTIGIDPGLSGAIAFMDADGNATVHDLPVIRDKSLAWIDGGVLQSLIINERAGRHTTAMIERVSAMPKQGVTSSFHFGVGFGSILGVLQSLAIPIEFVTPRTWKKSYGLDADKKAALHKARLLYPEVDLHLEKHDGRAEALLIARYARSSR